MITLDAKTAYRAARARLGLGPHDEANKEDFKMLELFIAGVSAGMEHALLSVKEKFEPEVKL